MSGRGDLVFMSSYTDVLPHARLSYKVPKDRLAVFVLLGTMERKEGASFDAVKALNDLGWVRADSIADPPTARQSRGGECGD